MKNLKNSPIWRTHWRFEGTRPRELTDEEKIGGVESLLKETGMRREDFEHFEDTIVQRQKFEESNYLYSINIIRLKEMAENEWRKMA